MREPDIEDALERRRAIGLPNAETDSYRLIDGAADGAMWDGVEIDVYGSHWVVQTRGCGLPECLRSRGSAGPEVLWWKRLEKEEKLPPTCVYPDGGGATVTVRENGVRFEIDVSSGYSSGLFLDQRLNRGRLIDAKPASQLNLFAYTCGFSVCAAMSGAQTASVDLSGNYLDWGRRNFEANGIDPATQEFYKGDASDWMRRLWKTGRRFEAVVVDPPTFSRNHKGKVFRVAKDLPVLIEEAARLLEPGGWLFCSTNFRDLGREKFEGLVEKGIQLAGRGISSRDRLPMPPDFTGEKYLKSLWLQAD